LVQRTALPSELTWDKYLSEHDQSDALARKISKVRELRGKGVEVLVVAADVTNLASMMQAVAEARQRFGPFTVSCTVRASRATVSSNSRARRLPLGSLIQGQGHSSA